MVLCGHSYGGFVISGVAEQMAPAIRSIVFLDAFVPRNGESVLDLTGPAVQEGVRNALQRGNIAIPPRAAEAFGVNEADRAWVDRLCVGQPIAPGSIGFASDSRSVLLPTRSRSPARAIASRARVISAPKVTPIRDLTAPWTKCGRIHRGAATKCRAATT